MTAIDAKAQLLENIAEDLRADGYEVFAHPSSALLPAFMKGYRPDAVAFRSDKNLAIEIKGRNEQPKTRIEQLQALFTAPEAKDWVLKVHYLRSAKTPPSLDLAKKTEIDTALSEVEALLSERETRPALLMAWAILEAMGRVLEPEKISRPQTPRRLIEVLAAKGHVTPSEAETLRSLIDRRNGLIHGGLNVEIKLNELHRFMSILKTLNGSLKVPENA